MKPQAIKKVTDTEEIQETKSSKELKSLEAKEELIMKYVLVLQRKWGETNNETTSHA
jgi:hypothetical protein